MPCERGIAPRNAQPFHGTMCSCTCVHVVGDVLPELDGRGHVHLQRALPRDGHRRGAVELIDVQELNQVADDEVDQGDRSGADTTTPTYNMNNVSKGGPYALLCSDVPPIYCAALPHVPPPQHSSALPWHCPTLIPQCFPHAAPQHQPAPLLFFSPGSCTVGRRATLCRCSLLPTAEGGT